MTERFVGLAYAPGGWQRESPPYNVTVFPPQGAGQTCYSQTKVVQPSMTPDGARLFFDLRLVPAGAVRLPEPPTPSRPEPAPPPVRAQEPTLSSGTGFLIDGEHVVTAYHVVEGATTAWVCLDGDLRVSAIVSASDPSNDICVLQLARDLGRKPLSFAEHGSLHPGEKIFLLGFPLAGILSQDGVSITDGIVASMTGLRGEVGTFQITAPSNAGNSGGPVVDSSGNVVGVLLSTLSSQYMMAREQSIPQGVNFAVHGESVVALLRKLGIPMQAARDIDKPMDAQALHAAVNTRVLRVLARK